MDRQAAGRKAEDLAADFLESQGLTLHLRNYRRRAGEIDVVASERDVLVIAEVRTRATDEYGGAAASVTRRKQARIHRAAMQLLQANKNFARMPVRFDVLVVSDLEGDAPRVEWIKHAFMSTR